MKYDCYIDSKIKKVEYNGDVNDLFVITLMILSTILNEEEFYDICTAIGAVKRETEVYKEIKELD